MSEKPIKFSSALVIVAGMWGGILGYLNYEDHRKAELERIEKVLSNHELVQNIIRDQNKGTLLRKLTLI